MKTIIEVVITHFNKVTGHDYRATSKATIKLITARTKEGFMIEDFFMVIDSRNKEWPVGSKMREYLRPSTLFNEEKFEGYLQFAKNNKLSPAVNPKMEGMVM